MSTVERYYAHVRRAYKVVCVEAPSVGKEAVSQMATKAVRDRVGPHGLILSLLVQEALPRLREPSDGPSLHMYQTTSNGYSELQ